MAGVVPIVPPRSGFTDGRLEVSLERFITLDELCSHLPEEKNLLEKIAEHGWHYLFIDGQGKVVIEIPIDNVPYTWAAQEHPRGGFSYNLNMNFDRCLPHIQLKQILNVTKFTVNISTADFPRAVTIDLTSREITYVHDSLWVSKGEGCRKPAEEILKILQWLMEEENYKLAVDGGKKHYLALAALFKVKNNKGTKKP